MTSATESTPRIRNLADDDWDAVVALEARTYGAVALSEDRVALESRGRASPSTCFVIESARQMAGYVLALPYPFRRFPDLTRPESESFGGPNLHFHDFVVAREYRGRGLAKRLLGRIASTAAAQGFERLSLVAVNGSGPFWTGRGFRTLREITVPPCYGPDAAYLTKTLAVEES
ncbi:GNAT family N-acetyltransferase [Streptomyces sp. NPDC127098]|uniref:GNAT family N-acetyltransferase n=1 Tax=Streptomyces sp. NPDC127098 TaxID=3347137 RepID=UPI003663CED3